MNGPLNACPSFFLVIFQGLSNKPEQYSKLATRQKLNEMMFESSIYYTYELANTQNVSAGDKSVWNIFSKTGNMFYSTKIKLMDHDL